MLQGSGLCSDISFRHAEVLWRLPFEWVWLSPNWQYGTKFCAVVVGKKRHASPRVSGPRGCGCWLAEVIWTLFHVFCAPRHFLGVAYMRFCFRESALCDFMLKCHLHSIFGLPTMWCCLRFTVIRVKSVTLPFDHVGGAGRIHGVPAVLFAFSTRC
jgi:hypothetical protein